MPIQDRPYYRDPTGPQRVSPFSQLGRGSVVTWLLVINFVVFVLDNILAGSQRASPAAPILWGNFNIAQGIYGFQFWRFITYQFVHGGLLHIVFNMMVLFFFGPRMEQWWGSRRFIAFYLLCGTSGAVLYTLLSFVPGLLNTTAQAMLIGASGSVYGLLIASAVLYPHQRVMLLFPPIPMSMRTMAIMMLAIVFLSLMVGSANAGGEAAHLGGAVLGFILIRRPQWLDVFDRMGSPAIGQRWAQRSADRQTRRRQARDQEVDRILRKVHEQGLASLTRREKQTLQHATDSQRRL